MVELTELDQVILGSAKEPDPSNTCINRVTGNLDSALFPLVTIGLPVFNGAATLARALETLVRQDYPNLQIIISDNASTDTTLDICDEFARRDPRIRIIRKKVNEGAVANFRAVLDAADGEFFMWAAADDYWHPQFISRLVPLLENDPGVGVAMCAIERCYPDGTPFDLLRFVGTSDPNHLGHRRLFFKSFSGIKYSLFIYGVFRTALLKRAIPSFSEVAGGDRQFMSHLALACRFAYLDEILHTRTYQPKNEQHYWAKMSRPGVLRRQLYEFIKLILGSPIIPWWRKPLLLPILPNFFFFNFRQTPTGRKMKFIFSKMKEILDFKRKFYLSNRAALAFTLFLAVIVIGGPALLALKVIPADISLLDDTIILFLLSCLVLLVRRWVIRSQKTTQKELRGLTDTLWTVLAKNNRQNNAYLTNKLGKSNERLSKELRYLTDTLLNPEIGVAWANGNRLSDHVAQRIEKHRKTVEFARALEESRIREVYIEELFPGIQDVSVPIGVINEFTGHANKTDMLYVSAVAKHIGARKMFEFGTYMGRTTLYLAHNNPEGEVFTLNLAPESDPRYAPFLGLLFRGREEEKRIVQLYADSREFDVTDYRKQFDFVFVDGDHSYELVKNDTLKAFELLKAGGVIMWHDYAPKSEGLVRFFMEYTQERPLFRIRSTCLLVYIDGIDVFNHQLAKLPPNLEQEFRESNPYLVETLYHS